MRLTFTFLLFICFGSYSQFWLPFESNSLILYEDPSSAFPRDVSMISFRESIVNGNEWIHSGYLSETWINADSSVCGGSWYNLKLTHPWFGSQVICDSSNVDIVQASGDTLHFDFSSTVGDTLWILSQSERIYGICASVQTENKLGIQDLIKRFEIHHEDQNQNPITASNIHMKELILGENLGFLTYFTLTESGEANNYLTMIGNRSLNAGSHSLTIADCYYFPAGTLYQVKEEAYPSIKVYSYEVTNFQENTNDIVLTYDLTKRTKTYSNFELVSDVTEIFENQNETYNKSEVISSNLHEIDNYDKFLQRKIVCEDTVFYFSKTERQRDTICYIDSTIAYYEIEPTGYIYREWYSKYGIKNYGYYPNMSGYYFEEKLVYLHTDSCETGEFQLVDINEIEDFNGGIQLRKMIAGTYFFEGNYDDVRVYSISGLEITTNDSGLFELNKDTFYIAEFILNGDRLVKRFVIK